MTSEFSALLVDTHDITEHESGIWILIEEVGGASQVARTHTVILMKQQHWIVCRQGQAAVPIARQAETVSVASYQNALILQCFHEQDAMIRRTVIHDVELNVNSILIQYALNCRNKEGLPVEYWNTDSELRKHVTDLLFIVLTLH